jgi:hypothetical protein
MVAQLLDASAGRKCQIGSTELNALFGTFLPCQIGIIDRGLVVALSPPRKLPSLCRPVSTSFPRIAREDLASDANLMIPAGCGRERESIFKRCGTGEGNLRRGPGLNWRLAVAGMYPPL